MFCCISGRGIDSISFFLYLHCYSIDVKEYVTGFGSPAWKQTHEAATKTAIVVTALLKNGSTCVGKTIMDEFGLGYLLIFLFILMSH